MGFFRSTPCGHKANRFRPQVEQLDERLLPSISNYGFPVATGELVIKTDSGNDGMQINDYGRTGPGNVEVQAWDIRTGRRDPKSNELNAWLNDHHVTLIRIWDLDPNDSRDSSGGSNRITYSALTNRTVSEVEFIGGRNDDEFTANVNGLAGNLLIDVVGGTRGTPCGRMWAALCAAALTCTSPWAVNSGLTSSAFIPARPSSPTPS